MLAMARLLTDPMVGLYTQFAVLSGSGPEFCRNLTVLTGPNDGSVLRYIHV